MSECHLQYVSSLISIKIELYDEFSFERVNVVVEYVAHNFQVVYSN